VNAMYRYKATVERIIDGDTVVLTIDLGFNITLTNQHIRLTYDAPELRTRNKAEKQRGIAARDHLASLIPAGSQCYLVSESFNPNKGKYGRIIGDITCISPNGDHDAESVEYLMTAAGHLK